MQPLFLLLGYYVTLLSETHRDLINDSRPVWPISGAPSFRLLPGYLYLYAVDQFLVSLSCQVELAELDVV